MVKKTEEPKKKEKVVKTKKAETVEEVVEKPAEELSEKEILKQAEEHEKARKAKEEDIKAEIKKEIKEHKVEEKKEKEVVEEKKISRLARKGKKYKTALEKIDKNESYEIFDAIKLVKETTVTKFDSSIDVHIRVDQKISNVRGTINFPSGAVKEKNVVGVDEKNVEEIVEKVKAGKLEFDVMVATPAAMPKLAGLAKILGPKGLMPNPKAGTVTENLKETIEDFKGGKVEYKGDKSNIVHLALGKVSTPDEKIKENYDALFAAMPQGKIVSIFLTTSMGPSVGVKIK